MAKIPSDAIVINKSDLDAIAKCQALKPTRDDLKKLPGYYEKPAKVHRTGVGLVDGYKWGVKHRPNDGQGKLTKAAEVIAEAYKSFARADAERFANKTGFGRENRMRYKGKRTLVAMPDGTLWKRIGDEWLQVV